MGEFLAVSAFRTEDIEAIVHAITAYCVAHDVPCERQKGGIKPEEHTDAMLYAPEHGWVRVLWPVYFNIHDFPLCQAVSLDKQLVISTVHVYDGDFWEHLFLNKGSVLHKFSSWPDYFAKNPEEAARAKAEYKEDPADLAAFLGISADMLSKYLVHLPITPAPRPVTPPKKSTFSWLLKKEEPVVTPPAPKACANDQFQLDNYWVFTDFWRRLGIMYPDPPDFGIQQVLRLDKRFARKLPTS